MAIAHTDGFVGTIESETRNVNRIWFSLTDHSIDSDWVKIGRWRAWFTMSLETDDRPTHLAQLDLLVAALCQGLPVRVTHGAAASFHRRNTRDTFEVTGVRILRTGLRFE
jgi:hypothetical protein